MFFGISYDGCPGGNHIKFGMDESEGVEKTVLWRMRSNW